MPLIRRALAVSGIVLLTAMPARALIPVTDIANLIESIYSSYQEIQTWMQESELMQKAMDQAGMNTGLQVDGVNNAVANLIVRQGRVAEEVQNLEVLRESMPAHDACDAVSSSVNLEDALCGVEDSVATQVSKHISRSNTLDMKEEGEVDRHIRQSVRAIVSECQELAGGSLGPNACFDTQKILGGSLPTLSPEEARATEAQITLIVDPIPERHVNSRQPDFLSEEDKLAAMRELSLKTMATTSLMRVRAERLSVDGKPSRLQLLRDFAEQHFGSEVGADFLAVITNTHPDKTKNVSKQSNPSQVLRSIATMDAFLVYMEVLKYEQQLRMEALQAGLLSVAVEPVQ